MAYVFSIDIDAPPERVFEWLDDGERVKRWLPNLAETEELAATPNRVGSMFRHVYVERGRRMEMHGVVTAYEPNRRYACKLDGDALGLTVDYRFDALDGGRTRLTQESAVRFKGVVPRVLGALVKPFMRKASGQQAAAAFAKLKQLAESGIRE